MPTTLTGRCGAGNKHHPSCSKNGFTRANEKSCTKRKNSTPTTAFKCIHELPDTAIFHLPKGWGVVDRGTFGIIEANQVKRKSDIKPQRKSKSKMKKKMKRKV